MVSHRLLANLGQSASAFLSVQWTVKKPQKEAPERAESSPSPHTEKAGAPKSPEDCPWGPGVGKGHIQPLSLDGGTMVTAGNGGTIPRDSGVKGV